MARKPSLKRTNLSQTDIYALRKAGLVGNRLYTTNVRNVFVRIGQKQNSFFFRSSMRFGPEKKVFNNGTDYRLPADTLKEAEEWALKFQSKMMQGVDPLSEYTRKEKASARALKQATHLSEVLRLYDEFRIKNEPWLGDDDIEHQKERQNYGRNKNRILKLVELSGLGEERIDRIDADALYKILDPITSASTLQKARASLEKVMDFANREKMCVRNEVGIAVKRVRGDKKRTLIKSKHFPSLDWERVPLFWKALVNHPCSMSNLALRFAIVTVTRSQAIRTLRYSDIVSQKAGSDKFNIARIRPENNKAKEETAPRDVVLSSIAVQIIDLARSLFKEQFGREATQNDLVFPNREGNPLSETAIRQLIVELHKRQKAIDKVGWVDKDDGVRMVTQHGFRSSFYSFGMEERGFIFYLQSHNEGKKVIVLDHLRDAIERSLLHVYDPSNLKNAYARHDLLSLRQRLMDAWGDFVQKDTTKID